jgi:hypothetical protein
VYVLPTVALLGGIVMLGALRTIGQDMIRADNQGIAASTA